MGKRSTRSVDVFAKVPVWVLTSQAVRTLPHYAKVMLFAFAAQYRGRNNGDLTVTVKMARHFGIKSKGQVNNAVRLLLERGLLIKTRQGGLRPLRPTLYALAWEKIQTIEGKPEIRATISPPKDALIAWNKTALDAEMEINRRHRRRGSHGTAESAVKANNGTAGRPAKQRNGTADGAPSRILGQTRDSSVASEGAAPGPKPKGPDARQRLDKLTTEFPDLSDAEVAKILKIAPATVAELRRGAA